MPNTTVPETDDIAVLCSVKGETARRGRGKWQVYGKLNALSELAKDIDVGPRPAGSIKMLSIPDVWAQVAIAQIALQSEAHPFHAQAIADWRGMIALVALQPFYESRYSLQTRSIDITELSQRSAFAKVLAQLPPNEKLFHGQVWSHLVSVQVVVLSPGGSQTVDVGALVPSILFAAGKSYGLALRRAELVLPWLQNVGDRVQFRDPCEKAVADKLSPSELNALLLYCTKLRDRVQNAVETGGIADPGFTESMMKLFRSYIGDCTARLRERSARPIASAKRVPVLAVLPPGFPSEFGVAELPGRSEGSDAIAAVRPEFSDLFEGAIIIDPAIADARGKKPQDTLIWGTNYAIGLPSNNADPEQSRIVVAQIKAEIVRYAETLTDGKPFLAVSADDIFVERLARLSRNRLVGQPAGFERTLLPLRPLAMALMSPEQLSQRISIRDAGEDTVVELRIPLKQVPGQGTRASECVIRKVYRNDAEQPLSAGPPENLAVWPNFSHPGWGWNYACFGSQRTRVFTVAGFFNAKCVSEIIGKMGNAVARQSATQDLAVAPISFWQVLDTKRDTAEGLANTIARLDGYPEATICQMDFDTTATPDLVGLILHKPATVIPSPPNGSSVVGIDFGTTNTTVYYLENGGSNPIAFADRISTPLGEPFEDLEQGRLLELIPAKSVRPPFMTVLRDRTAQCSVATGEVPVLAASIYYQNDARKFLQEVRHIRTQASAQGGVKLRFNLKWNARDVSDDEKRAQARLITLYLEQIVIEVTAELLAKGISPSKINWRFSYPEAFKPDEESSFTTACTQAIQAVFRRIELGSVEDADSPAAEKFLRPAFTTESLAAARFFAREEATTAQFGGTVITFDVGGGTSDMSIWQAKKLRWRSSVRLAGRETLTEFLVSRRTILDRLLCGMDGTRIAGGTQPAQNAQRDAGTEGDQVEDGSIVDLYRRLVRDVGDSGAERSTAMDAVEVILNSSGFDRLFQTYESDITSEPRELSLRAKLVLAALLHFIGIACKALTVQKIDETRSYLETRANDIVTICLGGRASILLRKVYEERGADRAFAEIFKQASGSAFKGVMLKFSKKAKQEVAFGLVAETLPGVDEESSRSVASFATENVKVGEQLLAATDDLLAQNSSKPWTVASTSELDEFLGRFKSQFRIRIDLEPNGQEAIRAAMSNELDEGRQLLLAQKQSDSETEKMSLHEHSFFEPPFIVGIRKLLELMNDSSCKLSELDRKA